MRALVAFAVALVFVVDASAARRPTPRDRAAIVLAVANQVQRENPVILIRIDRIVVSTVQPGPGAPFARFAIAFTPGNMALLGFYPSAKDWFVQSYGSKRTVCQTRASRFGGRGTAILRDLGLTCP
ncbi:MAG: hypothetical protein M3Q67_02380 [Actinomycetota bacterium]|nr:hypothetical protein [Actinomycetota bacterium]